MKTHCKWGHALEGENVFLKTVLLNGVERVRYRCQICNRKFAKETWERAKQRDGRMMELAQKVIGV